jgi:HlyD family secretion protein
MDRPLELKHIRQTRFRNTWKTVLALAVVAGGVIWLVSWISPSVKRNELRTAKVEEGPLVASISASGLVVPEIEQVLTSSIDSRILRIQKKAGDTIKANEPVILLDTEASRFARQKLQDQLALKMNARKQQVYTQSNERLHLQSQVKVKQLELKAAKTELDRNQELFTEHAISKSEFDKSRTAYETLQAQVQELKGLLQNLSPNAKLQDQGQQLEIRILQHELELLDQELARASTRTERGGVLTWVTLSEGATVRKGDVIAKIADLSTYRIDATVSDMHASRLAVGMPVRVQLDEQTFAGTISTILPTIENGTVKLQVSLKERSHPLLRPNRRVDVHLVTGQKSRTLKVRKGVNVGSEGNTEVFVLRDNKAVKTRIRTGISSFEEVEVLEGLQKGDEVIVSDMNQYQHLKELSVK